MAIRRQYLAHTQLATIFRSDHPPGPHCAGTVEEIESDHAVNCVESGSFGLNGLWLTSSAVFVSHRGARYRYTHRESATDVCLTIAFRTDCSDELHNVPVIPKRTNTMTYLWWRLPRVLATGDASEIDGWAAAVVTALRTPAGGREVGDAQLRWYAERVEATRSLLDRTFARQHSFVDLASIVGMSPFHFNRVFRQLTGVPPHQYLLSVRLNAARQMLLDGLTVTDACYDSGFASLSHFITSFKKRFGVTPGSVAGGAAARGLPPAALTHPLSASATARR
jgi:AraC-like DNA-binding protein